jgi:hypothetical protein
VQLSRVIRNVAAVVAAVVSIGLVGALPASAAPKPRLDISITQKPDNPSPSASATFAWISTNPGVTGATYTCSRDGATPTACSSPVTYSGLADGTHSFVVKGKKNGATRPGSATVRWEVDTVPPGAPVIAPVPSPTKNTSAVISFTNGDQSAVAHTCALDANAPVACTSPWAVVPSPLAEGSHTVTVRSRDAFGTLGGSSSVTWVVDQTAPAGVVLTGPASPTSNTLATFGFTSAGATSFTCALDGQAAATCADGYAVTVTEGQHSMVVTGYDAANNASLPGTATWTVDTTAPPVPSILTGPATVTNQTGVDFLVDNPDSSATLQCRLDGGSWNTCPSPVHYTVSVQGAHTLQVRAVDAAGNASAASSHGWTLDTTAPAPAQFLSGPDSPTSSTAAEFDFVPSDPSDPGFNGFVCSYDAGSYVTCDIETVPVTVPVAEGSHTLSVKTVDAANNPSGAAVTWTWVVDLTGPTVPAFGSTPADPTSQTTSTFVFSSEAGATFACTLDSGTAVPCASPYTLTGLVGGAHSFLVVASDAAGNTSQATHSWTVDTTPPAAPSIGTGPATTTNQTDADFEVTNPDGSAVLQCSLDGGAFTTCPSPVHLVVATEGPHSLEVRARDTAGNTSAVSGPYDWTLDTSPPAVPTFGSGPDATTSATSATFTFSSEPGTTFDCRIDGGSAAPCSSPVTVSPVAPGAHTFQVTASDAAGNTSTASRSWTVEAPSTGNPSPPATPPTTPPVTAPGQAATATYAVSSALTGTSRVTFSGDVTGVSATTVTLRTGSTGIPVVLGCATAAGAATACSGAVRAVTIRPVGHLVAGQTYVLAAAGLTGSNGKAVNGSTSFRASTVEQETSAGAVARWAKVKAAAAYGRSYLVADGKGATVSYRFTGRRVTWVTATGPSMGRATVYVDGVKKATVNNWSAQPAWKVARTIKGLKAGSHVLRVIVAGRAGHAGGGTAVALDAVRVGTKKVVASPVVTTTWRHASSLKASARGYSVEHAAGATMAFTFRGRSVSWVTATGPTMGKAKILVDGKLRITVDNYAARGKWGVKRTLTGLSDGVHTVTVVATGKKRARATGAFVAVDRWLVG